MKRIINAASACCKSHIRQIKTRLKGVLTLKQTLPRRRKPFFRWHEGASIHYEN